MGEYSGSIILDSMKAIIGNVDSAMISSKNDVERIYSFAGPLSEERIQEIASSVESKLIDSGLKKGVIKRTFTILIEGLQNAYLHGLQNEYGKYLGLSVFKVAQSVDITVLGVTDESHFNKVTGLVSNLNSMTLEEIKAHYLEVMTNGKVSAKGGAGLGLITMVMKSNAGIELGRYPLRNSNVIISSKMRVQGFSSALSFNI